MSAKNVLRESLEEFMSEGSVEDAIKATEGISFSAAEANRLSNVFNPFEILYQSVETVVHEVGAIDEDVLNILQTHLKKDNYLNDNNSLGKSGDTSRQR